MKEFNIELAKEGHPVCTRDGRPARIIYFGAKGLHPIVALIPDDNDPSCGEEAYTFTENGARCCIEVEDDMDLMMAPVKKQGWIGILRPLRGATHYLAGTTSIFATKMEVEDVIDGRQDRQDLIEIKQIEWEE